MRQIGDKEFIESIIATKKDAKLVAAAKNDRTNDLSSLYREFEKLPLERRREIIAQVSAENFVAAQWKIVFPLNNFTPEILQAAVEAAGKVLFLTREEDSVMETIRAIKIYEGSIFLKSIASALSHVAGTAGVHLAKVARIITEPEIYGIIKELDPANQNSELIVDAIIKIGGYVREFRGILAVVRFLHARRHAPYLPELVSLLENAIFLARDRRSVDNILDGLTAGSIDVVMQQHSSDKKTLGEIRDIAWKSRDSKTIRDHLHSYLNS